MTNLACARCGRLGQIEVADDMGEVFPDLEVSVPAGSGMLLFVCGECMTDEESVQKLRQSAVAMLDAAEELISSMEMIFERVPGMKDDPEAKEAYATAQEQAATARAYLAALEDK